MALGFGKLVRAAFGNAVVWGTTWTGLALLTMGGMRLVGLMPPVSHPLDYLGMALRIGFVGGIAGVLFSAVLRFGFRGKRLLELNATKFGLLGAVGSALLLPTFMQVASVLSGDGFVSWENINTDIVLMGVFGGVAAGLSLKLAQLASRFVPDEQVPLEIDETEVLSRLGPATDAERYARWERRGETTR